MRIIPFERTYRDDLIFMVLQAKDALGRIPALNEDLLDIDAQYAAIGGAFWIALDDAGRVIGSIGYKPAADRRTAELHRLFVKPALKRRGIGSALLQTAERAMKENGIQRVTVHLGEPEAQWFDSYRFYPKHGYSLYAPRCMEKLL